MESRHFEKADDLFEFFSPWGEDSNLDGFVFRGHSQESYKLIPTALRPENIDWFWKVCGMDRPIEPQHNWRLWQVKAEYSILRAFYRLSDQRGLEVPVSQRVRDNLAQEFDFFGLTNPHQEDDWIPRDLLETAALAQHYGVPTRLLDWTYDIYVALYFGFTGAIDKQGNIVLWALNKEHLSFLKPTVNRINVEFITPHYASNPNLNAQKGLFTHWPIKLPSMINEMQSMQFSPVELVDRKPLDHLIAVNQKEDDTVPIFKKYTLPCSEAKKGCQILAKLGYDSARIFPGYDGVAKHLLVKHKYS